MILIYNLSGFLLGLAGILVGLAATMVAGKVSFGILALALVWLVGGFWWRNKETDSATKQPYPSLFFLPLPFAAVPLILLSAFAFFAEKAGASRRNDPRVVQLDDDVKTLKADTRGGDPALASAVHEALASAVHEALADPSSTWSGDLGDWHIFARTNGDSVLVLLLVPDLKKIEEPARARLLGSLETALEKNPGTAGKKRFLGVRGKYTFGAIRVSPDYTKIANLVSDEPLLEFYGSPPQEPDPAAKGKVGNQSADTKPSSASVSADPISTALETLKGSDRIEKNLAIQKLARISPGADRRDEVVKALRAEFDGSDPAGLVYVMPALTAWATPEDLLAAASSRLNDKDDQVAHTMILALRGIKDPKAAELLASRLEDDRDPYTVVQAIQKQGPIAEPSVLKYAVHGDPGVRTRAFKVLEKVGGEASLQTLKAASSDPDRTARLAAESAISEIEKRPKSPAPTP